jgi:hypothetical protein
MAIYTFKQLQINFRVPKSNSLTPITPRSDSYDILWKWNFWLNFDHFIKETYRVSFWRKSIFSEFCDFEVPRNITRLVQNEFLVTHQRDLVKFSSLLHSELNKSKWSWFYGPLEIGNLAFKGGYLRKLVDSEILVFSL